MNRAENLYQRRGTHRPAMARTKPKLGADGLPEPLPVRPLFRPLAMVLGAVAGIAVILFLQQSGSILLSTTWIAAGILGGLVLGIALPSLPYVLVAKKVNRAVAAEREKRAHAAPMPNPMDAPPQGAS